MATRLPPPYIKSEGTDIRPVFRALFIFAIFLFPFIRYSNTRPRFFLFPIPSAIMALQILTYINFCLLR